MVHHYHGWRRAPPSLSRGGVDSKGPQDTFICKYWLLWDLATGGLVNVRTLHQNEPLPSVHHRP